MQQTNNFDKYALEYVLFMSGMYFRPFLLSKIIDYRRMWAYAPTYARPPPTNLFLRPKKELI